MEQRDCHRLRTGRRKDTKREIGTIYSRGQQVRVGNLPRRPGQQKKKKKCAHTSAKTTKCGVFFLLLFR